jgi:hypothetical protein
MERRRLETQAAAAQAQACLPRGRLAAPDGDGAGGPVDALRPRWETLSSGPQFAA